MYDYSCFDLCVNPSMNLCLSPVFFLVQPSCRLGFDSWQTLANDWRVPEMQNGANLDQDWFEPYKVFQLPKI